MAAVNKSEIIAGLQTDILRLQGFKPANSSTVDVGLGPIRNCFPNATFPLGCVHEFLFSKSEDAASTKGFISGLLSALTGDCGTSLWISSARTVFPPGLRNFGIQPDRFIFIDLQKESDVLWAMDEALKCGAIAAVVAEMQDLSFTTSRRFQLAVEQSKATGFIVRKASRNVGTTACVSRWKITPLVSDAIGGLPGIGFPKWRVELLRIRNGRAGAWDVQWDNGFKMVEPLSTTKHDHTTLDASTYLSVDEKKAG